MRKDRQWRIWLGRHPLWVDLALTRAEQEQGLGGRVSLGKDQGMLFVLTQDQPLQVWMKDTPFPLSLAFITGQREIISLQDLAPGSPTICNSPAPARFLLEVNQGWFTRHGVALGDCFRVEDEAAWQALLQPPPPRQIGFRFPENDLNVE